MGYIESSLMDGEVISYKARLSWAVILWPVLLGVIFLGVFAKEAPVLLILPGIWLVFALINYFTSEFGITNKRLVLKTGVIRRKSHETLINKIERINVDQSIVGRLLDMARLLDPVLVGISPFPYITDPLTFVKTNSGANKCSLKHR